MKKAYVDSLSEEEIKEYRGSVKEAGKRSKYANRSIEENLELFEKMKNGEFKEGEHVLRAKIDMSSPNMKMRDPLLYRIRHAHHFRAGDEWAIYPMYDFAHCLSDYIEGVSHSICTLEFENNRDIYNWVLDTLGLKPLRPYQHEFARLNINYTVMSKRKLLELIDESVAGYIFQNPNFFGSINDFNQIIEILHSKKALAIMSSYPISLGILKSPAELKADIYCGDGQCLGNYLGFGGPSFGILATKQKLIRNLPGRIVGITEDRNGKRSFVLLFKQENSI